MAWCNLHILTSTPDTQAGSSEQHSGRCLWQPLSSLTFAAAGHAAARGAGYRAGTRAADVGAERHEQRDGGRAAAVCAACTHTNCRGWLCVCWRCRWYPAPVLLWREHRSTQVELSACPQSLHHRTGTARGAVPLVPLTCQACQAAECIFAEAEWIVLLQVWRRQQQALGRRLQQLQERQSLRCATWWSLMRRRRAWSSCPRPGSTRACKSEPISSQCMFIDSVTSALKYADDDIPPA